MTSPLIQSPDPLPPDFESIQGFPGEMQGDYPLPTRGFMLKHKPTGYFVWLSATRLSGRSSAWEYGSIGSSPGEFDPREVEGSVGFSFYGDLVLEFDHDDKEDIVPWSSRPKPVHVYVLSLFGFDFHNSPFSAHEIALSFSEP